MNSLVDLTTNLLMERKKFLGMTVQEISYTMEAFLFLLFQFKVWYNWFVSTPVAWSLTPLWSFLSKLQAHE